MLIGAVAVGAVLAAQTLVAPQAPRSPSAATTDSSRPRTQQLLAEEELPRPLPGAMAVGDSGFASVGTSRSSSRAAPSVAYSLLQMNLCLSGMAACFEDTQYPGILREATDVITAHKPSAVSFNEACRGDIGHIAEQTRYHVRFAPVLVRGHRLPCVDPAGRGVFGNAVITREAIDSSDARPFAAQVNGEEQRGWICVATVQEVHVCTAHLSTRDSVAPRAANANQCAELAAVAASRDADGAVIVAGDINQQDGCAPARAWTLTDARASQLPGIQHSYGSAEEFRLPQVQILPATYSDHDFMLTSATLAASPRFSRSGLRSDSG